jgi:hypothetical protein
MASFTLRPFILGEKALTTKQLIGWLSCGVGLEMVKELRKELSFCQANRSPITPPSNVNITTLGICRSRLTRIFGNGSRLTH